MFKKTYLTFYVNDWILRNVVFECVHFRTSNRYQNVIWCWKIKIVSCWKNVLQTFAWSAINPLLKIKEYFNNCIIISIYPGFAASNTYSVAVTAISLRCLKPFTLSSWPSVQSDMAIFLLTLGLVNSSWRVWYVWHSLLSQDRYIISWNIVKRRHFVKFNLNFSCNKWIVILK